MRKISSKKPKTGAILARPLKFWFDETNNQQVAIEIVPLIDVIFCILTFFILAAVTYSRQQAINLDLPSANTGTAQMRQMLVISLDEFGGIYIEKEPVTKEILSQALQNYHQLYPNGLMVLHASKNATYSDVVEVLDLLREVGGDRVALATIPQDADKPDFIPSIPSSIDSSPLIIPLPNDPNNLNVDK